MFGNTKTVRRAATVSVAALAIPTLTGCGAARMHMRYGKLSTQVEMDESVFLDPLNPAPPTVYLSETSSSGEEITIGSELEESLAARGYTLVDAPQEATYIVQLNHLQLAEQELGADETVQDAVVNAYLAGASASLIASIFDAEGPADEIGAIVGIGAFILDASTRHVAYTLTTDVRLTEIRETDGGAETLEHATRIVSGASKVNLGRAEALPVLIRGVARSIGRALPPPARAESAARLRAPDRVEHPSLSGVRR